MAVIGAGIWGENHAMALSTYPTVELAWICDLNAERAKRLADKVGCRWTTELAELAASDVEAVGIATPDHAHKAPCLAMIAAGKHVLVEKPLTTDIAEARAIIAAAERAGVKLMVDFQLRWHPQYMGAKAAMESGELGEGVMGYARLSDTIHVPTEMLAWGGASGPEWFLFPHTMDVTRWILGEEPVEVFARGSKRVLKAIGIDAWDAVQALVQFERSFVTFETCWIIPEQLAHGGRQPLHALRHQGLHRARERARPRDRRGPLPIAVLEPRDHPLRQAVRAFLRIDPPLRRLRGPGPGAAGERPRRPDGDRDDPGDGPIARRRPPGQDGGGPG